MPFPQTCWGNGLPEVRALIHLHGVRGWGGVVVVGLLIGAEATDCWQDRAGGGDRVARTCWGNGLPEVWALIHLHGVRGWGVRGWGGVVVVVGLLGWMASGAPLTFVNLTWNWKKEKRKNEKWKKLEKQQKEETEKKLIKKTKTTQTKIENWCNPLQGLKESYKWLVAAMLRMATTFLKSTSIIA